MKKLKNVNKITLQNPKRGLFCSRCIKIYNRASELERFITGE
ncbi:hypothetical protein ACI3P4_12535 [Glaesserella parasuis]